MKKIFAVVILMFFSLLIFASENIVPFNDDNRIEKKFPERPKNEHPRKRPPRSSPDDPMNFRGMRVPPPNEPFKVIFVRVGKIKNGKMTIDIVFNQGINPVSVAAENIWINDELLGVGTGYMFSKNGNTVRITIKAIEGEFSLKLKDVESFSGEKLESVVFDGLSENYNIKNR